MMKTTGFWSRQRLCRRCLSSYSLSLAIGTAFFLLLVYMLSEEIAFRASGGLEVELNILMAYQTPTLYRFLPSRLEVELNIFMAYQTPTLYRFLPNRVEVELNISRWIIPVHDLHPHSLTGEIPDGWTLLVPYDANLSCSQCIVDDMQWTRDAYIRGTTARATPEVVYSRMVPVLFVIKSHAQQIVMSSDTSQLQNSMPRLFTDIHPNGVTGLEYYDPALTLDSDHFLYRSDIAKGSICKYRIRKCMRPLWTLGVACKTARIPGTVEDVVLDQQAPVVFASSPKFSIQDSTDGLFEYDGFWALFQMFVEHGDEASVWSLWAQRLMLELRAEMGIVPIPCPANTSDSASTNNATPSVKIQSVYRSVNSWKCPDNMDFFRCAISLAVQLHDEGHVTREALEALHVWLAELWAVNYVPPERWKSRACPESRIKEGCVIYSPALRLSGGRTGLAAYTTPQKLFPAIETKCLSLPKRPGVSDPFKPYILDPGDNSKVRDIALVLIFYDSSIYSNIVYLEDLHRKYFNQIIYCGPTASHFAAFYAEFKRPISYIEVPNTRGFVAHDCLTRAMMVNYRVNGYLEIADDVILNTWSLGSIPRDRFWFQMELRIASRHQKMMHDFAMPFPVPWWPWTTDDQKWGAKAMAAVWNRLAEVRTKGNCSVSQKIVTDFLEMLQHNSGNPDYFFYSSSDIFYVPTIFRRSWVFLGDIFVQNNVFLDVAVPTLMNGMDLTGNVIRLDGTYLWYNNRANYPAHYRGFLNFFHPWKMGWIHQPGHAHFMCYYILPFIVDDLIDKKQVTKT
ncbi:hypothetical protein EGW08_008972 [Elysia chlorotica]|uniref:Uncharacterized protein n=1 Tax=Elysia chlorotica TaxID=188477 RepID=A0A3S1A5I8_ELYCH|nr:hypothetical protein EGW08_008972 [Elysia chlorotica]